MELVEDIYRRDDVAAFFQIHHMSKHNVKGFIWKHHAVKILRASLEEGSIEIAGLWHSLMKDKNWRGIRTYLDALSGLSSGKHLFFYSTLPDLFAFRYLTCKGRIHESLIVGTRLSPELMCLLETSGRIIVQGNNIHEEHSWIHHLSLAPQTLFMSSEKLTYEGCLEICLYDNCDRASFIKMWDNHAHYDEWLISSRNLHPWIERTFVSLPNDSYDGLILTTLMENKEEVLELMVKHGILMSERLTGNTKLVMRG
jgi:hypothetical protein